MFNWAYTDKNVMNFVDISCYVWGLPEFFTCFPDTIFDWLLGNFDDVSWRKTKLNEMKWMGFYATFVHL